MTSPAAPAATGRTAPERLLLRLEWRVIRRLDGALQGGHRTAHRGTGTDFAGLREYAEGDDARHIDWNVTARLNEPYLRVFTEDRELTVWLVLDRSASMTVGAPGRGKHDVLAELAIVLARLFTHSGNRVGALLYDTATGARAPAADVATADARAAGDAPRSGPARFVRIVRPGADRRHVLRIAAELSRTSASPGSASSGSASSGSASPNSASPNSASRNSGSSKSASRNGASRTSGRGRGATTDLAAMLDAVAKLARRRSVIIVISDFIGGGDWERSLLRLAQRHEVTALRITDVADDELPQAGLIVVEDAETGEQLIIDSGDELLRVRLQEGVSERDARLEVGMGRASVPLHRISTADDLVGKLVEVVAATQRRHA